MPSQARAGRVIGGTVVLTVGVLLVEPVVGLAAFAAGPAIVGTCIALATRGR